MKKRPAKEVAREAFSSYLSRLSQIALLVKGKSGSRSLKRSGFFNLF